MDQKKKYVLTIDSCDTGDTIADQIAAGQTVTLSQILREVVIKPIHGIPSKVAATLSQQKPSNSILAPFIKRFTSWKTRLMRYCGCNTWSKLNDYFEKLGIDFGRQRSTKKNFLALIEIIRFHLAGVSKSVIALCSILEQQLSREIATLKGKLEFLKSSSTPPPLECRPTIQPNAPAL